MAENVILAIDTYGSHRVKDPRSGQMVSAYKMPYTSAACPALLSLYSGKARDVSSKHASYHYVEVDGETCAHHGYLLFSVSPTEQAQVEAVTRQHHRAGVFVWENHQWLEFPNQRVAEYALVLARSGPTFDPSGYRPVVPCSGEKTAAASGIRIETSQRNPTEKPWHWITGETYPHRELLKRYGARFSAKRKAWYYVGAELPTAIRTLANSEPIPANDAPCTVEEASTLLSLAIKADSVPSAPEPERLFTLGATVYARHELTTPDGKPIPTGTAGKITKLYNHNAKHGWSYDVEFGNLGVGWFFERELTDLEPIPSIKITRGFVVPPGAVMPPTDAEVRAQLTESGNRSDPVNSPNPEDRLAVEEAPKIRITKPSAIPVDGSAPDVIQTAIREVRTTVSQTLITPNHAPHGKRVLMPIPQNYVGELTGSISGNVYCYGYAVHEGVCVYVNMGGPRMAVEAIRARLGKGEIVNCVPWDGPAIELSAGEGNTGMYKDYFANIPEARFTSLILLHDQVINPNYSGKSTTFILHVSEEQAVARLLHHVRALVRVAVFDTWASYLWTAGQAAMLVRKTRGEGGLIVYSVDLDVDAWTRLITGGLEQAVICLPITDIV
jgi:hypothetical protein